MAPFFKTKRDYHRFVGVNERLPTSTSAQIHPVQRAPLPVTQGVKGFRAFCGVRWLRGSVWQLLNTIFCIALLIMISVLWQETRQNRAAIATLAGSFSEGGVGQNPIAGSKAVGQVYISSSPIPQDGYVRGGSLFRGSGFWGSDESMPEARSGHGVITNNVTQRVYVVGGRDSKGTFLSSVIQYDTALDSYVNSASMSAPRVDFAAASINGEAYIIGGFTGTSAADKKLTGCSDIYDINKNVWSGNSNSFCLQKPRSHACAGVINGRIYVAGGYDVDGKALASIEVGDPTTEKWTAVGMLPTPRGGVACAVVNNMLYVAGGTVFTAGQLTADSFSSGLVIFDPRSNSARALSPLLEARGDGSLVALPGGRLMLVGGRTLVNSEPLPTSSVDEYSVAVNAWVQRAPLKLPRSSPAASYLDGQIMVFGGQAACKDPASCLKSAISSVESFYDIQHPDVFVFMRNTSVTEASTPVSDVLLSTRSPALGTISGYSSQGNLFTGSGYWALQADMPMQLTDLQAITVGEKVYILGGADWMTRTAITKMWIYDPIFQTYVEMPSMPEPRTRFAAALLGDNIWVVSGFSDLDGTGGPKGAKGSIFIYSVTANSWTVSDSALNVPRSDACMAAVGDQLYLAGGYNENYKDTLSSVEVYNPSDGKWTFSPPMSTPRGDLVCTNLNDNFIVAAGFHDPSGKLKPNVSNFLTAMDAFSPVTKTWTALAPLPYARGSDRLVTLPSNRLLIMGGDTGDFGNGQTLTATHDVAEYLLDQNVWVSKAPLIFGRLQFAAAYVSGSIYAFGGMGSALCKGGACRERGTSTVEAFADMDYPPVFVYKKSG